MSSTDHDKPTEDDVQAPRPVSRPAKFRAYWQAQAAKPNADEASRQAREQVELSEKLNDALAALEDVR